MELTMKKLFAMLLAMMVLKSAPGLATEPLMFTQLSGRGTSNDIWVEITRRGLESHSVPYRYVVGTCAAGVEAWNKAGNTDPAVMLYSSNWLRHALHSGNPCLVDDHQRITVIAVMRSPWLMCRNKKTSRPFDAAGVTLGYHAASTPGKDIVADINASNGWQWKAVSTKGSGDNLMLLTNGDLDYGFINAPYARAKITADSAVECVASWKRGDDLPFFMDRIKMSKDPSDLLYFTQIIIGKNLSAQQASVLKSTYDPAINPAYKTWIQNQGDYHGAPTNSAVFMDQFSNQVRRAMENFKE